MVDVVALRLLFALVLPVVIVVIAVFAACVDESSEKRTQS